MKNTPSIALVCLLCGAAFLGYAYRSWAVAFAVLMLGFFIIYLNDGKQN